MDRSNPFDFLAHDVGEHPNAHQHHGPGSRSNSSTISELHNDFRLVRNPSRINSTSPIITHEGAPPPVPRVVMHSSAPTGPYMFDLAPFASTSTDAPRSSTQSNPSVEILPDTTVQSQPSSEPLIHLASSSTHGPPPMTQPSATGRATSDTLHSHAPRSQRRQTQWHPSFSAQSEPSSELYGFQPDSLPATSRNIPCYNPRLLSTATDTDLLINLFHKINDSTNRLSNAIILQQETLIQQQQTLSEFIRTDATFRREQNEIMHRQLETILSLVPKPVVVRVPPSHFEPNKADGISFDTNTTTAKPTAPSTTVAPTFYCPQSTTLATNSVKSAARTELYK